jgi:Ferredoxin subunits of nitrite reductase and ring-hydroxylating dioxygenases
MTALPENAGMQQAEKWEEACDTADFDGEEMLECRIGEREILLVRAGDRIVACPAMCPHMEERLAYGFTDGMVLTCSKHLWQWDLATGDPLGPAEKRLAVAPVRIEEGKVLVDTASLACGDHPDCSADG